MLNLSRFHPALCCVIGSIAFGLSVFACQSSHAGIVDLTVDPALSDLDLSISNSPFENTSVSGTGMIDVASLSDPFGTAQITALDLTLDDGLSFSLAAGFVTLTTAPGDVTISLVTPGPAGAVSGGFFDQLGNLLQFGGNIQVDDPFNLLGGSQTIDLATVAPTAVDFLNFQVTRTGNIKTVSGSFSLVDSIEITNGVFIPIVANGTFSASGNVPAIPEPGSLLVLGLACGMFGLRRQRRV